MNSSLLKQRSLINFNGLRQTQFKLNYNLKIQEKIVFPLLPYNYRNSIYHSINPVKIPD